MFEYDLRMQDELEPKSMALHLDPIVGTEGNMSIDKEPE
jgi:hypothetical protein